MQRELIRSLAQGAVTDIVRRTSGCDYAVILNLEASLPSPMVTSKGFLLRSFVDLTKLLELGTQRLVVGVPRSVTIAH